MKLSRWQIIGGVLALVVIALLIFSLFGREKKEDQRDLTEVITFARRGQISKIDVTGNRLTVTLKNGEEFKSRKEDGTSIVEVLASAFVSVVGPDNNIVVTVHRPGFGGPLALIISFLPLIIFAGVIIFLIRWAMRSRG